jgi:hypothetical protein
VTPVPMTRPRFKPEHARFRIGEVPPWEIRVGGSVLGQAAAMTDPDGRAWDLIEAMNGERTVAEIIAVVRAAHPRVPAGEVRDGIAFLISRGHVEDAAALPPACLTGADLARHDRNGSFYAWADRQPRASRWDYLALLRQARVTVAGMGGVGSAAARALAAEGVGAVHCVDADVVELSNLGRSALYTSADVGVLKVAAAGARLSELDPAATITGQCLRITGEDDILALAEDCDVLVLTADEPHPQIRAWCSRACAKAGTTWVNAGYHGLAIQVNSFVPGQGACWECLMAPTLAYRPVELATFPGDLAGVPHAPSSSFTAWIAGNLAALHAVARITGFLAMPVPRSDVINLADAAATRTETGQHQPGCEVCG